MEPVVVSRPEMLVAGLMLKTSFKDNRNKTEIPPFFHKVLAEGKLDSIPGRLNQNQLCVFDMKRNQPDFDYLMGVEVAHTPQLPEGMQLMSLPGSSYVSLRTVKRGPDDVGNAFGYLYKTWIPDSEYIPTGKPAFIYYDEDFFRVYNKQGYAGNPEATVFVPVRKLLIKRIVRFLRGRSRPASV